MTDHTDIDASTILKDERFGTAAYMEIERLVQRVNDLTKELMRLRGEVEDIADDLDGLERKVRSSNPQKAGELSKHGSFQHGDLILNHVRIHELDELRDDLRNKGVLS